MAPEKAERPALGPGAAPDRALEKSRVAALGGEEALARVRARRPDLILMDLNMPAMDGEEALRRLRADPATCDIPVILTTGEVGIPRPEWAAAVLTKPISRVRLLSAVRKALPGLAAP